MALAEIEALHAENERLRTKLELLREWEDIHRERDELRAEVEAWKERDAREHGELMRLRAALGLVKEAHRRLKTERRASDQVLARAYLMDVIDKVCQI